MTTQDKIKEVLKKVAEDLEVDTTYIEEKNVHLDRIVEITLKSCSEEISQVELQKEFHWDRIKELEKTIKSLHLQNIDLLADKAEQKAKVEKLKEGIAEKCSLKTQNRLFILIDKIFSPEEADLQEKK